MDINEIRSGVVGIRAKSGLSVVFAGTGFLVENNLILTCAHVLKNAARRGNALQICFDDPERFYPAEIVFEGDPYEQDVAVLKPSSLPDAPLTRLWLMESGRSSGHAYNTFGYPADGGGKGIFASGKIEGRERGELQISSNKITHGFSGAPLWDEDSGGVVGMVNAGFEFGLDKKLGDVVFAIPVETLQAVFPELHVLPARAPSPTLRGDLPHGSHLPFTRNGFFTGRAENLKKLAETLLGDPLLPGVVINQALTGMGGIGKTQLAVEFAYEYGHHFKGVHWLDLRDPQALDSQIALCGEKMGLPAWPPTLPEQVTATLGEWHKNHPRLLILDNFEDLAAANPVLARLRHSGLRLLLTSRRKDWPAALKLAPLPLEEFSPAESLAFLRNSLPEQRADDAALQKLAEHLGHLPLALELAGRYLERLPRLGIDDYLAGLEKALDHPSMKNWKPEQRSLTGHDLSLAQTFAQSWEQLAAPLARQVFIKAGYCAPNTPLPEPVLEAMIVEAAETLALDEALADLLGLGLLKEGPAMHPLLAQFARGLDEENALLAEFSAVLSTRANQINHESDRTGNYRLYAPLLPHVRAVAEKAEAAALEKAGTLWNSLGYYIEALADYAGARAAYERAIKILEANLGPDHPDVATLVNNLGLVLLNLGDLAGAKAACGRALKIDEAAYGPDHLQVATSVNNIGSVLKDLGDLAGARAAYERAIKIWEANLGPDHPQVAIGVNNLGNVLEDLGDLAGAQAACGRALKIDEAAYGPDHPSVARSVNNLGSVLKDLGDLAGARAAYERAIKILEANLGPDHPNVATGVNNLGLVLQDLGDLAGAKAAYERAIKIWEANLGHDHPQAATSVNNLGLVLRDLGDLAGAQAAFERALKIDEAAYGPDHPNMARDVNNLGLVLQDLGDLAGAKAAYERAIKIWEANLGPDHPQVATSVNNLGMVLEDLGDLAGARSACERALKIDEAAYGPNHPSVARNVNNLGWVLKNLGDLAGAQAAYERALKIDEAAYGPNHPSVAIRVNNLGNALQDLGNLAGAQAAYERALAIFEKFLPPDHPNIRIVRGNLRSLQE